MQGFSSTSLPNDQPGGISIEQQGSQVPSSGETVHNLPAETVVNIPNSDSGRSDVVSHPVNSTNTSTGEIGHSSQDATDGQNGNTEQKAQPEICADETVPKPD